MSRRVSATASNLGTKRGSGGGNRSGGRRCCAARPVAMMPPASTVRPNSVRMSFMTIAPLLFLGRGLVHLHLHHVTFHTHRVGTDLDFRAVRPNAVAQAKAPGVPGTGNDAFLNVTAA